MRMLLSGSGGGMSVPVSIPGYELPEGQSSISINLNAVGPNYFPTVGTRILEGRDFTFADGLVATHVACGCAVGSQTGWNGDWAR